MGRGAEDRRSRCWPTSPRTGRMPSGASRRTACWCRIPFYNNYFEIVQAPGYVAIVTEMMHEVRVIPLDAAPHVGAGVRMWSGDSRGWWEGQTLVVETTNFNDKKLLPRRERAAASRRAVHQARCRHDRVPPHGHRSGDVYAAVDARERTAAGGWRDLRGRLSRRQHRPQRHSCRSARSGSEK